MHAVFNFFIRKNSYKESKSKVHQIGLSCNPLPPVAYGGIETVITNLTKGLVREKIPVVCYCPSPFGITGAEHYPTLPESVDGPKQGVFIANSTLHLENIVAGLRKNWQAGDIIHLHSSEQYPYLWEHLRKWFSDFNYVETAHWTKVSLERNIAYPSEALKKKIARSGKVIPHGIDLSLFKPQMKQGNYLFYAGRITEDKGIRIGVEAANEYGIEFRIAGPVVDKEYAKTFMDKVNYVGELEGAALVSQYQNALAQVYMTQYAEPFGLSVVESLACGTPVITTGKGGTGETVIDGKTGFLCQSKNDILKVLDKVGHLSREDCVARGQDYSIAKMTKGYTDYYEELFG